MPVSENLIVITAQDLLYPVASVQESDCLTNPSIPSAKCDYALPSEDDCAFPVESDCACPDGSSVPKQTTPGSKGASHYLLPALHTESLLRDFHLAFNPLGQAGVVVFNRPVLALLDTFQQPRSLAEGVRLAGDPPAGLSTARRLACLDLLTPVSSHHRPRRAQARTLTTWLHVTNACNLRCAYCYLHKTPDAMEIERGRQAIDAVFRSAVVHGFERIKLKYAGGEATLNFPLLLALHDHAQRLAEEHELELDGVVLSNGVALTNRMIGELRTRGLRLMISLDGVGEYHDVQRHFANGRGSFAHVERTLDRLAGRGLTPSISITVSNRNLQGLPEVVSYVLKRELPFTINFYRENGCSASLTSLAYSDEQIITAMKAAFAVIEANLPPYSLLGALVDRARLDTLHDRPCGVDQSYLVIGQHGEVAKCHMEIEQTITDVSAFDPLQVVRDSQSGVQNPSVEEKEGCEECTWRYCCAGGCPALTYRVTGRFDIKSPNCRIYKTLFPEVLRLEGLRLLKYSQTVPL